MKAWILARWDGQLCGRCGQLVPASAPVQQVTSASGSWKAYRCRDCAGDAPPAMIDASEPVAEAAAVAVPTFGRRPRVVPPRRPVPLADIAKGLPFDARMAQTGEREPGADDE